MNSHDSIAGTSGRDGIAGVCGGDGVSWLVAVTLMGEGVWLMLTL